MTNKLTMFAVALFLTLASSAAHAGPGFNASEVSYGPGFKTSEVSFGPGF